MKRKTVFVAIAALLVSVSIATAGPADLARRIERAAGDATARSVRAPDRFEIQRTQFGGSDSIGDEISSIELARLSGPNQSGVVKVTFRLMAEGVSKGEARVTVHGRVVGSVLVAARPLKRSMPIEPGDVQFEERDLTRLTSEPIRDVAGLVGRVPARTLAAGRILQANLLQAEPVVRRGESVDVIWKANRLLLTVKGVALADGAPGDRVRVRDPSHGTNLIGRVHADGSVTMISRESSQRSRR